jgi:hypothetical protein
MQEQETQNEMTPLEVNALVVEVGIEAFEFGLTRIWLNAQGEVQIENRQNGKPRHFKQAIDPQEAADMIARVDTDELFLKPLGRKRGLPDEPLYHVQLDSDGTPVRSLRVWRSELRQLDDLARVIRNLQTIVNRASDGEVIL